MLSRVPLATSGPTVGLSLNSSCAKKKTDSTDSWWNFKHSRKPALGESRERRSLQTVILLPTEKRDAPLKFLASANTHECVQTAHQAAEEQL